MRAHLLRGAQRGAEAVSFTAAPLQLHLQQQYAQPLLTGFNGLSACNYSGSSVRWSQQQSALDRLRAAQKEEADAFAERNAKRMEAMPAELKKTLETVSRLQKDNDELVDVLVEHEFLGPSDLDELTLLLCQDGMASKGQALDISDELRRVRHLHERLSNRLEEVEGVLSANPC